MGIRIGAIVTMWTCLALCSCNSSPSPTQTHQSDYQVPNTITLTASAAVRDASNGTVIEGTTNLPDSTKLGIELMIGGRVIAQDFNVFVNAGKFHSVGFRRNASPLPAGKQKVHIFTYFNTTWQPPSVITLLGKGGSKLRESAVIRLEDAQLIDSDRLLNYTVEVVLPPLASTPSNNSTGTTSEATVSDKAIKMVKQAVLVVDRSRSSMTVEEGFQFYCREGIRMGNGWSATPTTNTSFNVLLDFINTVGTKEEHDTAIWEVNVATKQVLYRNQYAKAFSWIPKD